MSDLISRDALMEALADKHLMLVLSTEEAQKTGEWRVVLPRIEVFKRVLAAPTIDAVPVVHARWVHEQRYGDSGGWVWRCTTCRNEAISPIISALKYCHHCGAKMDGGGGQDGADD